MKRLLILGFQRLANLLQHGAQNGVDIRLAQRAKHDLLVNPVDELGPEPPLDRSEDGALGFRAVLGTKPGVFPGGDIRGQDEDGVAGVSRSAFGIGQAAFVEHLQEQVEDARMRLLDLIQQHDRIGSGAQFASELAFFLVADVAGRRANQLRYAVFFHVFRHVQADHVVAGTEQEGREGPRQLGLAHAGWAKEQEYSQRPAPLL